MQIIWYTANTFFNADNQEDFNSAVHAWNSTVSENDAVIVLGNFLRGSLVNATNLCQQLNGKIQIIMANSERQYFEFYHQLMKDSTNVVRIDRGSLVYDAFEASCHYKTTRRFLVCGEERLAKSFRNGSGISVDWNYNGGTLINGWHLLSMAKAYNSSHKR